MYCAVGVCPCVLTKFVLLWGLDMLVPHPLRALSALEAVFCISVLMNIHIRDCFETRSPKGIQFRIRMRICVRHWLLHGSYGGLDWLCAGEG
jgi:hypothetical protein